jgi:2-aminoadipate transaminase
MYKEVSSSSGLYNLISKEEINKSISRVLNSEYDYNYVSNKGIKELREEIVKFVDIKDITYHDILITNSSSESIRLIASLLNNSDTILVEEHTYFGAKEIFNNLGLNVIDVKLNNDGIDINDLKEKIDKYNPRMIYTIPTFNNPTGITWKNNVRKEFINVIKDKDIYVIEDDPYSLLNYTNESYEKLYNLDNKRVIYISSFSKYISPSFSVGYIIANKDILDRLYISKRSELGSNGFIQNVVLEYLKNNNLKELINKKVPLYKELIIKSKDYLTNNGYEIVYEISGGIFILVSKDNELSRFNICYMK